MDDAAEGAPPGGRRSGLVAKARAHKALTAVIAVAGFLGVGGIFGQWAMDGIDVPTDVLVVLARALLVVVFAAAGVGKLADRQGTRRALMDFGVVRGNAVVLTIALPVAELAVAAALLPGSSAKWGGIGALALLLVFSVAVLRSALRGDSPDCHCLGPLYSAPAGRKTLARNLLLAAAAMSIALSPTSKPGPSFVPGSPYVTAGHELAFALALGVVAGLAAYFSPWTRVFRSRPTRRRGNLRSGSEAPPFSLTATDGAVVTLDHLVALGRAVMLIFVDPSCRPCRELMPSLERWQDELRERLSLVTVSGGSRAAYRAWARDHASALMLHDPLGEVRDAYGVHGTPSAMVIGRGKKIEADLTYGPNGIGRLVADAVGPGSFPVMAPRSALEHAGNQLSRRQVMAAMGSTLALPWLGRVAQLPPGLCDPVGYMCHEGPTPGATTCCDYREYCCKAVIDNSDVWNCCTFGCRPEGEVHAPPNQNHRGGCLPGPMCGPDVTQPLHSAIAATKQAFEGWTARERKEACNALVSWPSGKYAWDIVEFARGNRDWLDKYQAPPHRCATPGTSPKCNASVAVGGPSIGSCYFAGSVNYVIFGVMCRLCNDHVGGRGQWSHDDMLYWIALYKAYSSTFSDVPANTGPAAQWASAGWRGWPTPAGPIAPPGDRANCGLCPVRYSDPMFTVAWEPRALIHSD